MASDDLPQHDQQHLDEQTAGGLPRNGPGRDKTENLRRIRRQTATQRRRLEESDPHARGGPGDEALLDSE